MDGHAGDSCSPEGGGVAALPPPEITYVGRKNHHLKPSHPPPPSKCAKKSWRSMQKRVVSVPVGDGEGFRGKGGGSGAGEAFPPSDSWQWRKYGQKPIKGSPYPRGYYRCSSCKGCPARKQVERSRLDPNVLVVAYSFEHDHPWPLTKNARRQPQAVVLLPPPPEPAVVVKEEKHYAEEEIAEEEEEEEDPLLTADGGSFRWFTELAFPCSTSAGSDELLYGSVLFGGAVAGSGRGEDWVAAEAIAMETAAVEEEEEDSLFEGLGELPEYSVVLRRELEVASWMGTDG